MSSGLTARFWGVRGSISVAGPDTVRYGGNTPCLEVNCSGKRLIFDAGTGLRALAASLGADGWADQQIELFFSHAHLDHVAGFPFFGPIYAPEVRLRLWGDASLRPTLAVLTGNPFHPVPLAELASHISFETFAAGTALRPCDGVTIRTAPLRHPNGAVGFRIEHAGRSLCYVTDTEHDPDRLDDAVLGLIRGADTVIYDAMFLPEEFEAHRGWGHSTWEAGIQLVEAAGAGNLVLFHHAPERTDDALDRLTVVVDRARPGTRFAMEGMLLRPGAPVRV